MAVHTVGPVPAAAAAVTVTMEAAAGEGRAAAGAGAGGGEGGAVSTAAGAGKRGEACDVLPAAAAGAGAAFPGEPVTAALPPQGQPSTLPRDTIIPWGSGGERDVMTRGRATATGTVQGGAAPRAERSRCPMRTLRGAFPPAERSLCPTQTCHPICSTSPHTGARNMPRGPSQASSRPHLSSSSQDSSRPHSSGSQDSSRPHLSSSSQDSSCPHLSSSSQDSSRPHLSSSSQDSSRPHLSSSSQAPMSPSHLPGSSSSSVATAAALRLPILALWVPPSFSRPPSLGRVRGSSCPPRNGSLILFATSPRRGSSRSSLLPKAAGGQVGMVLTPPVSCQVVPA